MPKYDKMLAQAIIAVKIANNILEEVFAKHPDIANRAIVRVALGDIESAKVQLPGEITKNGCNNGDSKESH